MTEVAGESERHHGQLGTLCASWRDVQQLRLSFAQREQAAAADALLMVERSMARAVTKELRRQPVYPWLSQFPGLRGVHVARLIAIIGDPFRFPGQGCTEGHAFPPRYVEGDQCPVLVGKDEAQCVGRVIARHGTGTRSLWHYLGLHVVGGKSPRKARGQQADWHMEGRAAVQMPGGIAEQIVRQNVEPYVGIYRATKARLSATRAVLPVESDRVAGPLAESMIENDATSGERADLYVEIEAHTGPLADDVRDSDLFLGERAQAETGAETDTSIGLRPFQIDAIARKVAAKAFVGDLLAAMKAAAAPVDFADDTDAEGGRSVVA